MAGNGFVMTDDDQADSDSCNLNTIGFKTEPIPRDFQTDSDNPVTRVERSDDSQEVRST